MLHEQIEQFMFLLLNYEKNILPEAMNLERNLGVQK